MVAISRAKFWYDKLVAAKSSSILERVKYQNDGVGEKLNH